MATLPLFAAAATFLDPVEEAGCVAVLTKERSNTYTIEAVEAIRSYYTMSYCVSDLAEEQLAIGDEVTLRNLVGDGDTFRVPFSVAFSGDEDNPDTSVHFYTEAATTDADVAVVEGSATATGAIDAGTAEGSGDLSSTTEAAVILIYQHMLTVLTQLLALYSQLR